MNDNALYTVINEILKNYNIHAIWESTVVPGIDGILILNYKGHEQKFFVAVKKELREFQIMDLLYHAKEHQPFLVVAETIFPKMKDMLLENGIGYIDINGNLNIETQNLLIRIEGKRNRNNQIVKQGRAFTKTGLKAIFLFLTHDNAFEFTYREIADKAGIAIGNVGLIQEGLIKEGFALKLNDKKLRLTNRRELIQKWVMNYTDKLKPTLHIGNFRFENPDQFYHWKTINVEKTRTQWGGEGAGNIYTDYLQPEILTLYTSLKKMDLIREYRLIPDPKGEIQAYLRFWQEPGELPKTVPPLIAYADLVATGNRRCTETAQKIYDQYITDTVQ
jgi:hypothetical protein